MKLLEEAGVIDRYVAVLNPAKIGKGLTFSRAFGRSAWDEETLQKFANEIMRLPQVLECYFMLGDYDAMIRGCGHGYRGLSPFPVGISEPHQRVQNLKTDVPSQIVKQISEMPL